MTNVTKETFCKICSALRFFSMLVKFGHMKTLKFFAKDFYNLKSTKETEKHNKTNRNCLTEEQGRF